MGLFDIFKKRKKFVDELFGELTYNTWRDSKNNNYEGTVKFGEEQITVILFANEQGPTKAQQEFYKKLRDTYTSFKTNVILPYLNRELDVWLEDKKIVDFDKEFRTDGISIHIIGDQPVAWEITLYSHQIDHFVTIEFLDFTPQEGVIVDG